MAKSEFIPWLWVPIFDILPLNHALIMFNAEHVLFELWICVGDYKERKKHRSDIKHKIDGRETAPSTSQLFFVRTMIRALYDDNSPGIRKSKWKRTSVLNEVDVKELKTFYNDLIKFVPLLDLGNSVRQASDLSDLWYREFYIEMTKCAQVCAHCLRLIEAKISYAS